MANPIGNGNPLSPVADYMAPIDPPIGTYGTPSKQHDNPAGGTTAQAIKAFLSGNQANTSEETPNSPQFGLSGIRVVGCLMPPVPFV